MFLSGGNGNVTYAERCYDIKYEEKGLKMPGNSHGDNNPSEKRFEKMIKEGASLCEVSECYDDHKCKGELTGKDLKNFYKSIAFESGSEDQQKCIKHRGNLPDGGQKALQAYEIKDCALKDY